MHPSGFTGLAAWHDQHNEVFESYSDILKCFSRTFLEEVKARKGDTGCSSVNPPCLFDLALSDGLWAVLSFLILWSRTLNNHNKKCWYPGPKSLRYDTFHCSAFEKSDVCACLPASLLSLQIIPFSSLSLSALHRLRVNLALFTIHDPISREGSSSACNNTQTLVWAPQRKSNTLDTLCASLSTCSLCDLRAKAWGTLWAAQGYHSSLGGWKRNHVKCFYWCRFTKYLPQSGPF